MNPQNFRLCTGIIILFLSLALMVVPVAAGLADTPWPKYQYDLQNTGQSPYVGPQADTYIKWTFTGSHNVPVIGTDGTLYVGGRGVFYAVDPNRTYIWRQSVSGRVISTAAIGSDGTIFFGTMSGQLYALNPNGTVKWSVNMGAKYYGSPAIGSDGTVYIAGYDGKLRAYDPDDGTLKWSDSTATNIYWLCSPAIGTDGTIYAHNFDKHLYAFNPNGTLKWSNSTTGYPSSAPAIGVDGTIYVINLKGSLDAFNPNGTRKWTKSIGGRFYCGPVISTDGTIYVGSSNKNLYALDQNETLKWTYTTGGRIMNCLTLGADGTIYFSGYEDRRLYALNPDGILKWSYAMGGYSYNHDRGAAIGSDGTLYVATCAGIHAFAGPVDFTADCNSGAAPLDVQFTGTCNSSVVTPSSGSWNFGDGTNSTKQNPVHTYASPGSYTVRLNMTDSAGTNYSVVKTAYIKVYTTPKAAFTSDVTSGMASLTVNFTDTSANNPTSWLWDFGDGTNSTEQNPVHIYPTVGTYNINLTATNVAGTNSILKTGYINVTMPNLPVASFTSNVTSGTIPLTVTFTDLSTKSPTSWLWDFGDGTNSTEQNPVHTYAAAGIYTVNLTAYNDRGSNTTSMAGYITASPVVSFTGSPRTSASVPLTVKFNDTSILNAASTLPPKSWFWEFGDGTNSTGQNPEHTYEKPGTYTVNLTITSAAGSSTVSKPGFVTFVTPGPIAYNGAPIYVANDKGIKHDIKGTNSKHTPNTYDFSFGTGGLNALGIHKGKNSGLVPTTNQSGTFEVRFYGGQYTMHNGILMLAVNETIPDDFSVHIRASGDNWTLGKPGTSNLDAPTEYNYVEGVVNETFTKDDFIYGPQIWKPCSKSKYPIYYGQNMSDTGNTFRMMFIDLYSGITRNKSTGRNAHEITVEYSFNNLTSFAAFNAYGWYVSCNHGTGICMTNDLTRYSHASSRMVIGIPDAPVANFTSNTISSDFISPVQFTDTSANVPQSWLWEFGDGNTSTEQNPSHTYASAGTYTVNLTVTNIKGTDKVVKTDYITKISPQIPAADFKVNTTSGSCPLPVRFTDTSANTPSSWYWDFGDGTYSTDQNPFHWYGSGTYTVNLTVTNSGGTNSTVKKNHITVAPTGSNNRFINQGFETGDMTGWTTGEKYVSVSSNQTHLGNNSVLFDYHGGNNYVGQHIDLTGISNISFWAYQDYRYDRTQYFYTYIDGARVHSSFACTHNSWTKYTVPISGYTGVHKVQLFFIPYKKSVNAYVDDFVASPDSGGDSTTAPAAQFTSDVTSGEAPLTVQFTDTSTNNPTSWLWEFGDGTNSTGQSPAHTYTDAGTYTVNLTATNTAGSSTVSKTGYITVESSSAGGVLPGYTNVHVRPANHDGIRWNYNRNGTYYINKNDGGLNAVHISTDPSVNDGQVTVSPNQSGTFYVTDTGGRGYQDEIVLMLAVNGTIPDDFSVRIKTSGYTWTPGTTMNTPPQEGAYTHQPTALYETFTKNDFIYGPQSWKPSGSDVRYPILYGEDMDSDVNRFRLAFIDTRAGVIGSKNPNSASLTDKGAVKIEYTFNNLSGHAAFNAYAWNNFTSKGRGMGWTNRLAGDRSSGYSVIPSTGLVVPVAIFNGTPTHGTAPLTVSFNDLSTGSPNSWAWDFDNDTVIDSTEQHPEHTYTSAGTYNVSLTVTNDAGTDTEVETDYIAVSSGSSGWDEPVAAGLADTPWPKYQYDLQNTGQSPYVGPQADTDIKWTFTGSHNVPAIGTDGTLYTSGNGVFYAVDPNGTEIWHQSVRGDAYGMPAIGSDDTIFFGTKSGQLYALNPNGTVKWSVNMGVKYYGSPAIGSDGTVYFAGCGGKLCAYDPDDGTLKWSDSTATHNYWFGSPAIGTDGTIYAHNFDKHLYAFNPNGTLKWLNSTTGYPSSAPAIGVDGTIYVMNYRGSLDAFNPNGTRKWTNPIGGRFYCGPAISTDGTIYVGSHHKKLYALDQNGTLKWTYTPGGQIQNCITLGADGTIYFSGYEDRRLYALNPDGTLKWSYAMGGYSHNQNRGAAIGSDGTLYVGTNAGIHAFAGPVDFTADRNSGAAPLAVQFTSTCNSSVVTPSSWSWNFGDGTNSTKQNPIHTYASPGSYTVRLNITDNAGTNYSVVKTAYIKVYTTPKAAFTSDVTSGMTPLTVNFTDTSANTPTSWFWDFGDGTNSTEQNPIHKYPTVGTYNVNLTATNVAGTNSILKTGYINVTMPNLPVASFTSNVTSGTIPLTVTFTDLSTKSPTSWLWEFGDGTNSTEQNPSHTYASAGTYTVNLTASNDQGSNTASKAGYITVESSSAGGVLPGYTNIHVRPANHDGVRWDYNRNGTYYINKNDGGLNAVHISTDPAVNDGQVTVSPNQSGTFYVTDTGGRGYQDEIVLMLAVNGTLPDDFSVRIKTSGYTWTPGATMDTPPQEGAYTHQPTALYETFTKNDFIYGPQSWKPSGSDVRYPILYGEDMDSDVNRFRLAFIDTRAGVLGSKNPNSASLTDKGAVKIEYTFNNLSGHAAFNAYAWNNFTSKGRGMGWTNRLAGDRSSGYSVIPSQGSVVPVAIFNGTPTHGTAPLTVSFNDLSTGSPKSWAWDFDNNGDIDSTEQNPEHTYTTAGTYNVSLTVTNDAGTDTGVKTDYITVSSGSSGGDEPVAAGLADTPWPKYQYDLQNTGQSPYVGPQADTYIKWTFTGSKNVPAIGTDGTLYTGGRGVFYAVEPNGTEIWRQSVSGRVVSTPAIGSDGTIFFGTFDKGQLYALNPNGTVKWSANQGVRYYGSPAIGSDGTVYIAGYDGKLRAYDPDDGTLKWSDSTTMGKCKYRYGSPAIGTDGTIYVHNYNKHLYAFNPNGTLKWSNSTTGKAKCAPAIGADGTIYVMNYKGSLDAFNPNGTRKWTNPIGGRFYCGPVISTDGTIYVGSIYKKLYALDQNGTLKWTYTPGGRIMNCLTLGADGTIYFSGYEDRRLYALNPDGILKWSYVMEGNSYNQNCGAAIGSDGALYVGTYAGIHAFAGPVDFTADRNSGAAPLAVQFTSTCNSSVVTPSSWSWNFGDGTNSTGQNPVHTYASPGSYTVRLNITDNAGTNYSVVKTAYIKVYTTPKAAFTSDVTSGMASLTVNFTDTSANNPTSWLWDFGDGTNSTEQNPVHIYPTVGTYNINLTATNVAGTNSILKTDYINVTMPNLPVASFTSNVTSGAIPLTVTFTDLSTKSPTSWLWDFGDGTNSTEQNPVHTYAAAGIYTVNLTASNDRGSNTTSMAGYITASPVVSFTGSPRTSASAPLTVKFNDTSILNAASTLPPKSWFWEFGDGTNSTEQNPEHTYEKPGTYTVNLTITSAAGSSTVSKPGFVTFVTPGPIPYNGAPIYVANDKGIKHDIKGTNPNYIPNTYGFSFGTGGLNPLGIADGTSGLVRTTNQSGTFEVRFAGGQDTMHNGILMLAVNGAIPDDFSVHIRASGDNWTLGEPGTSNLPAPTEYNYVEGVVNETFTKDDFIYGPQIWKPCSSSNYPIHYKQNMSDTGNTFRIMFIDLYSGITENKSTERNAHEITVEYSFNNLTSFAAFNAYGWYVSCSHGTGICMTNNVARNGYMVTGIPDAPVANFTSNTDSADIISKVQFTDTSENVPQSWLWEFGDGTTSTEQNPTHTYTTPGTYTVNLTATNIKGTDKVVKTDYITKIVPSAAVAGFTANATSGTCPHPVQFNDQSTGTIVSRLWNFGDGTTSTEQNPVHCWYAPGIYSVNLTVTNSGGSITHTEEDYIIVSGDSSVGRVINPDFETGDLSGWDSSTSSLVISSEYVHSGNFSLYTNKIPNCYIEQHVDLTGVSDVSFWVYKPTSGTNAQHFILSIDGTTVQSTTPTNGEWINYVIPVSGYSGTHRVRIGYDTGYTYYPSYLDDISLLPETSAPIARFAATPVSGESPLTVNFTDASSNYPASWAWDFDNDGVIDSVKQSPTHIYTAGTYTVNLTVANAAGSDAEVKTDYITVTGSGGSGGDAPVASFTATPLSGDTPLTVQFTDTSSNHPTVWAWDFDNNGVVDSKEQNPEYTYTDAGKYTVKLKVTNDAGTNTKAKANYIVVSSSSSGDDAPVASFTATPLSGDTPLTVQFTDTSSNHPMAWAWDFDNNGAVDSTEQSPEYTYTDAGKYTVKLTVTNDAGTNTKAKANYIVVSSSSSGGDAPVASFTATPLSGDTPLTVQFTDTSSNHPTAWAWDFDNNGAVDSTEQNPEYTYTDAGKYTVKLTATNLDGSNTVSKAGYITVKSSTDGGVLPGYTNIHVRPSNHDGVRWDYNGNGTYYINENGGGLNAVHISTDPTVSYGQVTVSPNQSGTFYVTNTGGRGYQDEIVLMLAVNGTLPDDFSARIKTSGYTWTPGTTMNTAPQEGAYTHQPTALSETFTRDDFIYGPQSWKPSGSNVRYPILYGEDMDSDVNRFRLAFIDTQAGVLGNKKGDFASLIDKGAVKIEYTFNNLSGHAAFNAYAWNNFTSKGRGMGWTNRLAGDKSSGYSVIPPTGQVAPVAIFNGTPTHGTAPLTVSFNDLSTGSPNSWAWDFDNNGAVDSTEQSPEYTYTDAGKYTVKLTVTNEAGTDTEVRGNYITVSDGSSGDDAPVASFTATPLSGDTPLTVQFTDTSSNHPTAWAWDFNNNGTIDSTEQSPEYTYTDTGIYTVKLTVTNEAGTDTEVRGNYITVSNGSSGGDAPVASFTATPLSGDTPLLVQFTDTSSNHPTAWAWDFDNNGTIDSTEQSPEYTYTDAGTYTVNLTVTNEAGTDTEVRGDYITVSDGSSGGDAPIASFTATPESGEKPLTVRFTDTSLNNPTSWAWYFDNDDTIDSTEQNPKYTYTVAGIYNVKLTVTNDAGSNETTHQISVSDVHPPIIEFSANRTWGKYPMAVQFTDESTLCPISWLWDFGDGTNSTEQNPMHIFRNSGDYDITLTAANTEGSNTSTKTGFISVGETYAKPLPAGQSLNLYVANDEGVKYNVENGVTKSPGHTPYVFINNTYHLLYDGSGGGTNALHVSNDPSFIRGQITTTSAQSGEFWLTFTGGQPNLHDALLLLAVNGTIPDDFSVNIRSSGYDFEPPIPGVGNNNTIGPITHVEGAVDQTFTREDFIYGPQIWRPHRISDYPIFVGQNMSDTENTFELMFIDLRLGCTQTKSDGYIKVEYSFNNLTTRAAFNAYGWYSASNHGTGIIMASSGSEYIIDGNIIPEPEAGFTANVTSGSIPLSVAFTDISSNNPTGWFWDFNNDGTIDSTIQNPSYTYQTPGFYSVNLTVTNDGGTDNLLKTNYIRVSGALNKTEDVSIQANGTLTDQGNGKKQYSINQSEGEIDGNNIIIENEGYTLTIKSDEAPSATGGNLVSNVTGIDLATEPVETILDEIGNVSGSLNISLNDLPENSNLKITLEKGKSGMGTAFQLAANASGLDVNNVAYTMNIVKTNLTNGQEIKEARIRMTVPVAWVNANGGKSAVKIIRIAEDGTKEVIKTTWIGTSGDLMTFEGYSPKGLSMFGLASVKKQPNEQCESSSSSSHKSSSGGGMSKLGVDAAEKIPAGESGTLLFDKTPITEIKIYADKEIPEILITTESGKKPDNSDTSRLVGEIYDHIRVIVYKAPENSIEKATIRFNVPKNWVDSKLSSTDTLSLYLYDKENTKWILLSTVYDGEENGYYSYFADTASFGVFAISELPNLSDVSDSVPEPPEKHPVEEVTSPSAPETTTPTTPASKTVANAMPLFGGGMMVFVITAIICIIAFANRRFRRL